MEFSVVTKKFTGDTYVEFLPTEGVSAADQKKGFAGEADKIITGFGTDEGPRLMLVGLGKQKELTLNKLRSRAGSAVAELKKLSAKKASIALPRIPRTQPAVVAQALTESLLLAAYEFTAYKTEQKKPATLTHIELVVDSAKIRPAVQKGLTAGQILGRAVRAARDLGNHPSNIATPKHLAGHAEQLAKQYQNIRAKILNKAQIKKEKMGALLAVAQGSQQEPRFIILEYTAKKKAPTVVLIGKGITFDSGGISIKPSEKMEEMKFDMAGAATVLGTIEAAAESKLPINLVGLIPATENLPSGTSIKPGDIVKSRSGKTIEVVNTDAEGRVVLADALDYAKQFKPALMIDFATLTGAIVVALGDDLIGAFTNSERYLGQLKKAAQTTGEKLWPMPLEESYQQFIKSDFADLRNVGTVRFGDSINAALFLQHFVDYPWIHLDIAGAAWATREKPCEPKGATGAGIRLAIEFLKNFKKA